MIVSRSHVINTNQLSIDKRTRSSEKMFSVIRKILLYIAANNTVGLSPLATIDIRCTI